VKQHFVAFVAAVCVTVALGTQAWAQQPAGALERIKASGTVNVAYSPDSLPFSFTGSSNAPAGYSIDLCKRVIAQIGNTLAQPNLKVNWVGASTPERLQMVASGKADLECANTTQTLSRLANVDFSSLIFIDAGAFLVRTDSSINRVSDLAGKKIAVLKGTTTETRLRALLQQSLVNATVVPVEQAGEGMTMLDASTVDAYAGDKIKLLGLVAQSSDPRRYQYLSEELSFEPYAFALPRNDSALRLEVNRALTQIYMSGEIETIFMNWLGKLGRPSGLLAAMYLLYSIPQ
jgi:glutamate/aspartate transport system substrate-binding protein